MSENYSSRWIGQPDLYKNLEKKFGNMLKGQRAIVYLLRHMKIEVELPIRVNVDNIRAIFLAENQNSSDRTKHVDIRYHFIRQYIKDGTIMIEFVCSSENDSDIFTKNVTSETFSRHSEKLTWTKENLKRKQKLEFYQQEGC